VMGKHRMTMIRVLLADDHPIVRQGLRALLADEPEIAVVGEATTGDEVQEACRTLQPDVLLLDLSMPGPPAADTVRSLRVLSPAIQIVMLTAHRDEAAVRELVSLGVGGYVLKDDEPETVAEAIVQVAGGGTWFSAWAMEALVHGPGSVTSKGQAPHLTSREKVLLELVKKGWNNKHIATELSLGDQSVRNYLRVLYGKLGGTSRPEAVVWTHEHEFGDG